MEWSLIDVDIGPLHSGSDVQEPVPFPAHVLPPEDVWLTVLFSSSDTPVAVSRDDLGVATAVEARLLLPRDGGRAQSEEGGEVVRFFWAVPSRPVPTRARLSYLYRNTIVQSQRIDLTFAAGGSGLADVAVDVQTDFTLSRQMGPDLEVLKARTRVTIIANERAPDQHDIAVRAASSDEAAIVPPAAFSIRTEAVGPFVDRLRRAFSDFAPTARQRRRGELVGDLRRLAPLGWQLYSSLPADAQHAARVARQADVASVIQVCLPRGSSFTLPWNLLYDIFLDSEVRPEQLAVCPVVNEWDERAPLVEGALRECPRLSDVDHTEGVLCPFGFWGFRYTLEVLSSTDKPKTTLKIPSASHAVIAKTRRGVEREQLDKHMRTLRTTFATLAPGIDVTEVESKQALRTEIDSDVPLLYFLCHGERDDARATTVLGVGKRGSISPSDVNGWIDVAFARQRIIWDAPQPLVFINACGH